MSKHKKNNRLFKRFRSRLESANGELMAFTIISILVLGLYLFIVAFVQYSHALHNISRAIVPVSRTVAVAADKATAEHNALEVAKAALTDPKVNNIEVEIKKVGEQLNNRTSVDQMNNIGAIQEADENEEDDESTAWKKGDYCKVTITATVHTLEPYILSRTLKKSHIVTIEYEEPLNFLAGYNLQDPIGIAPGVSVYEAVFRRECERQGIPEWTNFIMALATEETAGTIPDIMACSEAIGLSPGAISDPEYSIQVGVRVFRENLEMMKAKGVDLPTMIHSYNYGPGFADYVSSNYGGHYSLKAADEFAAAHNFGGIKAYDNEITRQMNHTWRYNYGVPDYAAKLFVRHFNVPIEEFLKTQ